jgi:hypothetical protein
MDALSGPRTAGHTGYTGTSMVIDFASHSFAILLTNRVHPSRSWGSNNAARREWARGLALSMGVRPSQGDTAWWSGARDGATSTLTAPVAVPSNGGRLSFDLFLDTEETDLLHLETSTDGGQTWQALPFAVRDRGEVTESDGAVSGSGTRHWMQARAGLAAGEQLVRWRYTTDGAYVGRGVLVDDVFAQGAGGVLLDGEKSPELFSAEGWAAVNRQAVA